MTPRSPATKKGDLTSHDGAAVTSERQWFHKEEKIGGHRRPSMGMPGRKRIDGELRLRVEVAYWDARTCAGAA
jgi:hypothetical protein